MRIGVYHVWEVDWIFCCDVMSGAKVRKMQASDMAVIMQIKTAENWNQTETDWQFLITSNPELCFVAIINNEVIGTVTAINYHNKIAWIGMMLVSKLHRGMGISKMLLNTIIEKLKGCESIRLDATPAGIPVYKKLGFVEEYKITRIGMSTIVVTIFLSP